MDGRALSFDTALIYKHQVGFLRPGKKKLGKGTIKISVLTIPGQLSTGPYVVKVMRVESNKFGDLLIHKALEN